MREGGSHAYHVGEQVMQDGGEKTGGKGKGKGKEGGYQGNYGLGVQDGINWFLEYGND